jgi:hypothetical protein
MALNDFIIFRIPKLLQFHLYLYKFELAGMAMDGSNPNFGSEVGLSLCWILKKGHKFPFLVIIGLYWSENVSCDRSSKNMDFKTF